ncbi:MAG: hypothetical protein H6934_07145 [Burkholderiaceae bacterium]|nr:hypothetical protein [Burkholderiaceae bacterium]
MGFGPRAGGRKALVLPSPIDALSGLGLRLGAAGCLHARPLPIARLSFIAPMSGPTDGQALQPGDECNAHEIPWMACALQLILHAGPCRSDGSPKATCAVDQRCWVMLAEDYWEDALGIQADPWLVSQYRVCAHRAAGRGLALGPLLDDLVERGRLARCSRLAEIELAAGVTAAEVLDEPLPRLG